MSDGELKITFNKPIQPNDYITVSLSGVADFP